MRTKAQPRFEVKRHLGFSPHVGVGDTGRVLAMRHEHAPLDGDAEGLEPPHRQATLEPELDELRDG